MRLKKAKFFVLQYDYDEPIGKTDISGYSFILHGKKWFMHRELELKEGKSMIKKWGKWIIMEPYTTYAIVGPAINIRTAIQYLEELIYERQDRQGFRSMVLEVILKAGIKLKRQCNEAKIQFPINSTQLTRRELKEISREFNEYLRRGK